jgi:hypothetical protein
MEVLEACKKNKSLGDTAERCRVILSSAGRFSDGSLYVIEEKRAWNEDGMYAGVFFDKEAREYYLNYIDVSFNNSIKKNYSVKYSGVALDSFGQGLLITYAFEDKGYAPGSEFIPYYQVDKDGRPFLPYFAGLFQAVKDWKSYSPRGVLINGNYMMPELIKYNANIGNEIKIGDDTYGYIKYTKSSAHLFWSTRFASGSKSMSFIDNSNREVSFLYKEEYFSAMASFGSASGWFSHNAANNNLWRNKSQIDYLRPFIKRWMPSLNESFNGNIFYANGLGLISMVLPVDKQNPPLDSKNELSTTSLWCKPKEKAVNGSVDCYLAAFLGYAAPHSVGKNFNREAVISINGNNKKCLFTAQDITCSVGSNGDVTIRMHGLPTNKTYRTAIIKFQRKLTKYPDGIDSDDQSISGQISPGGIVAIVLVVCVIIACAAFGVWFYMKKMNRDKDNEIAIDILNATIV